MKTKFRRFLACLLVLMLVSADLTVIAEEVVSSVRTLRLPAALQIIEEEAFCGDQSLDKVVVPEGTTEIRSRAFAESSLVEIELPASLTFIAEDAFAGCAAVNAWADSGSYAEEYCIENGIAIIDSFEIELIDDGTAVIYDYYGSYQDVVVPSSVAGHTVTRIGMDAFMSTGVRKVTLPEGIVSIGSWAFENCNELTEIILPDTLESIGSGAFQYCNSLSEIILPESVTTVGSSAFMECGELVRATLPASLKKMPSRMFQGCASLAEVNLPEGLEEIGNGAFSYCWNLENISLPNSLRNIGSYAFENTSLKKIEIPDNVTELNDRVFSYCYSLREVTIPASVTSIGNAAFEYCERLELISVHENNESYTVIDGMLFTKDGSKLVVCPGARSGDVVILDGTVEVGAYAFCGCEKIACITIPASVEIIDNSAFYDTVFLALVEVGSYAEEWCKNNDISYELLETDGGQFVYELTEDGSVCITGYTGTAAELVIPVEIDGAPIRFIGEDAFVDNKALTRIHLPDGLAEIRAGAFSGCTAMTTVHAPASLESIGENAFGGCTDLTMHAPGGSYAEQWCADNGVAYVQSGIEALSYAALEDGSVQITGYTGSHLHYEIPETIYGAAVSSINSGAFEWSSNLETIVIPKSVTAIDAGAFSECQKLINIDVDDNNPCYADRDGVLTSKDGKILVIWPMGRTGIAKIPEGVVEIGEMAFYECDGIEGIEWSADIQVIGEEAFAWCSGIVSMDIPDTVKTIGASAFRGMNLLSSVTLGSGLETIGDEAFKYSHQLKEIDIPGSIREIPSGFLMSCDALERVSVGDGVEQIGSEAFAACPVLTDIILPASVNTIAKDAFDYSDAVFVTAPEGSYAYQWAYERGYIAGLALIESAHPYASNSNETWRYEHPAEADNLKVSFSMRTYLESDYDMLYVIDSAGTERCFTGSELAGEEIFLPGNSFEIRLESGGSDEYFGFSVTDIQGVAESELEGYLYETAELEDGTLKITGYAKYEQNVAIPSQLAGKAVTVIGSGAFSSCALTSVVVPEGVVTLEENAFANNSGMKLVSLPSSLTLIDDTAFSGCGEMTVSAPEGSYAYEWAKNNELLAGMILIESAHPYAANSNETWEYVHPEEAEALKVTFSRRTEFETGYDYLTVTDSAGAQQVFTGTELVQKTIILQGNTFSLCLESDGGVQYYGFAVIAVEAVTEEEYEEFLYAQEFATRLLDDGTLEITGYTGNRAELEIPSEIDGTQVTGIGSEAFNGNSSITSVTIPEEVTYIGNSAFHSCSSLTSVTILSSEIAIDDYAFNSCPQLETVVFGDGMISLGDYVFYGCALKKVYVETLECWCSISFGNNYSNPLLYSAELYIGGEELSGDVVIPDGIAQIGDHLFDGCSNIISVTIPEGVTSLGEWAFGDCYNLEKIVLPASLAYIDEYAFANDSKLSIYAPEESYAWQWAEEHDRLPEIAIIESEHPYAPNTDQTWEYASDDEDVYAHLITFSRRTCFAGGDYLVITDAQNNSKYYYYGNLLNETICVPGSSFTLRLYSDGGSEENDTDFGFMVTSIEALSEEEFLNYGEFTYYTQSDGTLAITGFTGFRPDLEIPAEIDGISVTRINGSAFYDNANLESIVIPEGITYIANQAFYSCNKLASVVLPDSLTCIDSSAFYNCDRLTEIVIPEGVTTIGASAFRYCYGLQSISLPTSLTCIDSYAFYNCDRLTEIVIPEGVTTIGDSAFRYCFGLQSISLPAGLISIADDAFADCSRLFISAPEGSYAYEWAAERHMLDTEENRLIRSLTTTVLEDGTLEIDNYDGDIADVVIPQTIDGVAVTSIGSYAFYESNVSKVHIRSIVIPEGVTRIEDGAFCHCNDLMRVELPSTLKTIGEGAFNNCPFTEITLPEGLESIGSGAFTYCGSTTVNLPSSLTYIDDDAFVGCPLTSVYAEEGTYAYEWAVRMGYIGNETAPISDFEYQLNDDGTCTLTGYLGTAKVVTVPSDFEGHTLTSIGQEAFADCHVTVVTLPEGVKEIGSRAFMRTTLTQLNLPDTLTTIESDAFFSCFNLRDLTLPDSVTYIGFRAFVNCESLKRLRIPSGITGLSANLFEDCTGLVSVELPAGLTSVGDSAFIRCSSLESIELPEGVTYVGSYAFANCSSLKSAVLPESLTSIGEYAFLSCSALEELHIPAKVSSIGTGVLGDCSGLNSLTLAEENVYFKLAEGCLFDLNETKLLYFPMSRTGEYTVPDSVRVIDGAFDGCTGLTKVVLPDGITSIGSITFRGCSSLAEVNIPQSVTYIGSGAFMDCSVLDGITLPGGLKTIGQNAFRGCSSLCSIVIPGGVSVIDYWAFLDCTSLSSVGIGSGVQRIAYDAFGGCTSLTEIIIPNGVTTIEGAAFYRCSNLVKAVIPSSVTSIGYDVFMECSDKLVIYCEEGSYAETYADENGIARVITDTPTSTPTAESTATPTPEPTVTSEPTPEPTATPDPAETDIALLDYTEQTDGSLEITGYRGEASTVILPDVINGAKVTSIGANAFSEATSVTEIWLPASVTNIVEDAFGADGSQRLHVAIGSYAEDWCYARDVSYAIQNAAAESAFTTAQLEDGTVSITGYSGSASSVIIPAKIGGVQVTAIADSAFGSKKEITSIALPKGIVSIGADAFYQSGVAEIIWPDTLITIGDQAFYYSNLTKLALPNSVRSVGDRAFCMCAIEELEYPVNLEECGWAAFSANPIESYAVPEGVTHIIDNMFSVWGNGGFRWDTTTVSITLPSTLVSIGADAFASSYIETITIPEAVTYIEAGAFEACSRLKEVRIQGNVNCENSIFYRCDALVKAVVEEGVEVLGDYLFCDADKLSEIELPSTLKHIGKVALFGLPVTELILPDSLETVGDAALQSCPNLRKLYIGPNVRDMGGYQSIPSDCVIVGYWGTYAEEYAGQTGITFESLGLCDYPYKYSISDGCVYIERYFWDEAQVEIPAIIDGYPVIGIGEEAFKGRKGIMAVTIPEGIVSIGNHAFYGCSNLASVDIPNSVTFIGQGVFNDCGSLTVQVMLGSYAETYCQGNGIAYKVQTADVSELEYIELENGTVEITGYTGEMGIVVLPDEIDGAKIVSIGADAFSKADAVKEIGIPVGVTNIDDNAFATDGSQTLYVVVGSYAEDWCYARDVSYAIQNAAAESAFTTAQLEDGTMSITGYSGSASSVIIPAKIGGVQVTAIADSAFRSKKGITSIALPKGIVSIGADAFYQSGVAEVIWPDTLITIGDKAFCSAELTRLTLPASVRSIGMWAFRSCEIAELEYPRYLEECGRAAFADNLIEHYVVPEGVTHIIDNMFSCLGLDSIGNKVTTVSIDLPSTLVSIGTNAFSSSTIETITVPPAVTYIGYYAFAGCRQLTEVRIQGNLNSDGVVFDGCDALSKVIFEEGVERIGDSFFHQVEPFPAIEWPSTMKHIGKATFAYTGISTLMLPDSIETIDVAAFQGCDNLKSLYIGPNVREIGYYSFAPGDDVVIYGVAGSYAQTYAEEYGLQFCTYIPPVEPEEITALISGCILSEQGMGVEGVVVRLLDQDEGGTIAGTAVTQSDGSWEMQYISGANCTLEFLSPYYSFQNASVDFVVLDENAPITTTAYLESGNDSSSITVSLQETEIVVGSEATFDINLSGGNMVLLIVDGIAYEKYFADEGNFVIKRVFSKAGTRSVVFQAGTDGVWGELSEELTLNVTAQGTLSAPKFELTPTYCVEQPINLSWNSVEHADRYTVYAYLNGSNVFKENTTETAITLPAETAAQTGNLSIEVIATGYGYSQASFSSSAEIINTELSILFTEKEVEVGSVQGIKIRAPGAAGVRYRVDNPDGDPVAEAYVSMSEDTLTVSVPDVAAGTYSVTAYAFTDGFNDYYAENTQTFEGIHWIKPSVTNWKAESMDANAGIKVESSFDWDVLSTPDWISAQRVEDELQLSIADENSTALAGYVLIGNDALSCEIGVQAPDYTQKPDILYPAEDGLALEQADAQLSWNSVEGADEYLLSLRDLTTDILLLKHVPIDVCAYDLSGGLLLNGHEYRLAIGAKLSVNGNIVTSWAERLFTVSANGGYKLSGQLYYSDGTSAANHLVYLLNGEILIDSTTADESGHWSFDGLAAGASYTVSVYDLETQEDIHKTVLMGQTNMTCEDISLSCTAAVQSEFCGIIYMECESSVEETEIPYDIDANADITCEADWLTAYLTDNGEGISLCLSALENESDASRETVVTLTSGGKIYEYSVIQESGIQKVHTEYLASTNISASPFVEYKEGKWSNAASKGGLQSYNSGFKLDTTRKDWLGFDTIGTVYVDDSLSLNGVIRSTYTYKPSEYPGEITIVGDLRVRNSLKIHKNTRLIVKGDVIIEKGGSLIMEAASSYLSVSGNLKYSSSATSTLDTGEIHVWGDIDLNEHFTASGGNVLFFDGENQSISYKKGENGTKFATVILEHALAALDDPGELLEASIELIQFGTGGKKYTISTEDTPIYTTTARGVTSEDLAIINTLFAMRYHELNVLTIYGMEFTIGSNLTPRSFTVFVTDKNGRLSAKEVTFGISQATTAGQNTGSWIAVYNGNNYTMTTNDFNKEVMEIYQKMGEKAYDDCKALLTAGFTGTSHNFATVYLGQAYGIFTETFDCSYILTMYDSCKDYAKMIDECIE